MADTTADNDSIFLSHTFFEVAKVLIYAGADFTGLTTDDHAVADSFDNTDDVDAATKPVETSGTAATLNATGATINQEDDDSDALPAAIIPTDSQDVKIKKWNLWINHYWQVQDCRDLIPENLSRQRLLVPSHSHCLASHHQLTR